MITKLTYLALNKIDHLNYWLALQQFAPVDTLMDIGCGNHPQDFIKVTGRHYTVDPKSAMADARYFHVPGTWQLQAMDILKHHYVHTVVLMDVVEHLEKAEALRLLAETVQYAKQVIVFTPLGFLEQVDEGNPWNTHRSGWVPEDFGEGWGVQVFPYFHWCDFKGGVLDKPHGAILAVWRRKPPQPL